MLVSIHARQYWRAMLDGAIRMARMMLVSIHARQYWRAMPRWTALSPTNPAVSIHARQYWRAMLAGDNEYAYLLEFQSTPANTGGRCSTTARNSRLPRRFNPRPPILAGDARQGQDHDQRARFQSTPANTGGRCDLFSVCQLLSPRFNPRPPILAGDAPTVRPLKLALVVSIHARQYWRAMPG